MQERGTHATMPQTSGGATHGLRPERCRRPWQLCCRFLLGTLLVSMAERSE